MTECNNTIDYRLLTRCLVGVLLTIGGYYVNRIDSDMSSVKTDMSAVCDRLRGVETDIAVIRAVVAPGVESVENNANLTCKKTIN